jgi:hypothetical protein
MRICNLRLKKFYNIGPWGLDIHGPEDEAEGGQVVAATHGRQVGWLKHNVVRHLRS